jgi:Asp/Glu/hydantoin racemase
MILLTVRGGRMRIWWQSFVDPSQNEPYLRRLGEYLSEIADPGTEVHVAGTSPPDRAFGRLTEFRCAALAIENALDAPHSGYDAFVFGHFQDPGLYEARSAVEIPVVGLGEMSLHWAAQLGRHIALVSIDEVFRNWHLEQADLYGLHGRVTHVSDMGAIVETFAPAFAGETGARAELVEKFRSVAEPLVADGADVVIPAGALPCLLLAPEHGLVVGHAPVVNCIAVALKCAEAAVKLRELTGLEPSRGPSFALAPRQAIDDFRSLMARGRNASAHS